MCGRNYAVAKPKQLLDWEKLTLYQQLEQTLTFYNFMFDIFAVMSLFHRLQPLFCNFT